jgi:putative membrane protein
MRRLWLIVTIPLTILFAVFAVANREQVSLSLWPLDIALQLPLFLLALGTLALGLLIGAFLIWIPLLGWRHHAHAQEKRANRLEAELAAARAIPPARPIDAPTLPPPAA